MKTLFEIIAVLSPIWIVALIALAAIHCENRKYNKIKFKEFKKFYELNPYRWRCETDYVSCKINKDYDCEVFMFSVIDKCKYRLWRRSRNKINMNKKHAEATQRMLDAVKEDITKAKEKEITSAIDIFAKEFEDMPSILKILEETLKKHKEAKFYES